MALPRRSGVAVAVAATALLLAACDSEPGTDEEADAFDLVAAGTLTVCSDAPYEPFAYEDPEARSGYAGFDIDLAQEIADRLDLELAVRVVTFESIASGLALTEGDCDVAASAISITEARAEGVDFTVPYYDSLQSLLVPVGSGIGGIDDTDGARIGVQAGTTGEVYADANLPDGAEVVRFDRTGDLFAGLGAGTIDGILQDLPVNVEQALRDDHAEVVATYETGEQYGMALAPDRDDRLRDAIDEHLSAIRDDGTYDELYERYFGTG